MEIIIFIAVVVGAVLFWNGYTKARKADSDQALDEWKPISSDKPWPYGEKIAEGKIHVKPADVAPGKSADDRVEAPAPVVEQAPAKKAAAKKPAAKKQQLDKKPAVAKRAPAKKKSI
jgi:trigger factor